MNQALFCCLICLPLHFICVTSSYGFRMHPVTGRYGFHEAVDLRANYDSVFSVAQGIVVETGYDRNLGRFIRIGHEGWQSVYGHLAVQLVAQGDPVAAGQMIAVSGGTGRVTAPHLHFAILLEGRPVDPLKFLYQLLIRKENE